MSHDKNNEKHDPAHLESDFDVFRRDGSTRLPSQQFPATAIEATERTGPVEPRVLNDIHNAPPAIVKPLLETRLQDTPAVTEISDSVEPITIRLETYSVDLAARIARVKAEQKDALDGLQHLEEESKDESKD
ncbi:MAG: hypothetical protein EBZ75_02830 [Oxalobacteraceae bacterium]|jgi:hypothetical protein|nr:hypothetical protein [Oxalobacteraceae bacterium]